jgi:hypothetical protein
LAEATQNGGRTVDHIFRHIADDDRPHVDSWGFAASMWAQAVPGENSQTVGPQIAAATEEIRKHPRDANAYVTRSYYYLKPTPSGGKPSMKNAELAIQDLEMAIQLDPNNYAARHNYAHAAYLFGFDNFVDY